MLNRCVVDNCDGEEMARTKDYEKEAAKQKMKNRSSFIGSRINPWLCSLRA